MQFHNQKLFGPTIFHVKKHVMVMSRNDHGLNHRPWLGLETTMDVMIRNDHEFQKTVAHGKSKP